MTGGGRAGLAAVKRVGGRCTIIDGDDDKDGGCVCLCGYWDEASAGGDVGGWRCAREKPRRWCESSGSSAPAIGGRTRGTDDTPKRHGGGSAAACACRDDGAVAPLLAVGAVCGLAPKGAAADRVGPVADAPEVQARGREACGGSVGPSATAGARCCTTWDIAGTTDCVAPRTAMAEVSCAAASQKAASSPSSRAEADTDGAGSPTRWRLGSGSGAVVGRSCGWCGCIDGLSRARVWPQFLVVAVGVGYGLLCVRKHVNEKKKKKRRQAQQGSCGGPCRPFGVLFFLFSICGVPPPSRATDPRGLGRRAHGHTTNWLARDRHRKATVLPSQIL